MEIDQALDRHGVLSVALVGDCAAEALGPPGNIPAWRFCNALPWSKRLPTLTAVKVILYQGMKDQGIGKAELARRLGWHLPQVDRVLDVNHRSRLDRMDAALGAIGRHLEVSAKSTRR